MGTCLPPSGTASSRKDASGSTQSDINKNWPAEYPLPLMPPASFPNVDEIADYSRRCQNKRVEKAARILEVSGHSNQNSDKKLQDECSRKGYTGNKSAQRSN